MTDLTNKQRRFCEHYVVHGGLRDAYRYAYNAQNMGDAPISVEASRLMKNPKIALFIYEMRTDARKAFTVTIAEKKEWLKQIVDAGLTKQGLYHVDLNAAKGAINELNKMDGDHATVTTKQEITGDIGTRALSADEYKTARDEMLKDDDC